MAVLAVPVVEIGSEVLGQPGQFSEPLPQSKLNFSFRQGLTYSRLSLNLLCDQWWPQLQMFRPPLPKCWVGIIHTCHHSWLLKISKTGLWYSSWLSVCKTHGTIPMFTYTQRQQAIVYQVRKFILPTVDKVKGLRGFGGLLAPICFGPPGGTIVPVPLKSSQGHNEVKSGPSLLSLLVLTHLVIFGPRIYLAIVFMEALTFPPMFRKIL